MASPFIVVVVVALADSSDEASRVMTRTVQDALAETALVVVREEARPDDGALLTRLGDDMHANAVVVVQWSADDHAVVRVYRTSTRAWTARDVGFSADDPPRERGRTLGYGIASIVRATVDDVAAPERPPPPDAPPRAPAPPPALPRWDVELAGQAALPGSTTSLGGAVGGGLRLVDRLTMRVTFAGRAGSVDEAAASSLYLRATGGASWAVPFHRFTVGPRLELGAIRQQLSRSGSTSSGGQWSGVMDLRAEGTAALLPRLVIVVGIGAEVVLEEVPVRVDRVQVGTLAPARALGSVGVRFVLD